MKPARPRPAIPAAAASADDDDEDERDGFLKETHETAVNGAILFIGIHICYVVVYRRKFAKFMLFLDRSGPEGEHAA
jgi:cytochrome b